MVVFENNTLLSGSDGPRNLLQKENQSSVVSPLWSSLLVFPVGGTQNQIWMATAEVRLVSALTSVLVLCLRSGALVVFGSSFERT